ncbi:MAG: type II toxin-antitoxin system RelE/ParE family toxin [bacterium]
MEKYKITIKPSAAKELKDIPQKDFQRITKKIQSLSVNPRPVGCEKLSGQEKYRFRQGDYRIIYSVDDDIFTVSVVKIGNRREIYKH